VITTNDDITTLVQRVAACDPAAFANLYRLTARRLYGVVQRLLLDSAQSEEVVQEVYLEVWLNAGAFSRDRATAFGWMCMIARRRAIDRVRASQASRARDAKAGRAAWMPPDDDFADAMDTRLGHSRALAALGTLTGLQREAVELVYCEQLSVGEAAQKLRVAPGVVRSRARDGITRLRSVMAPSG
jgi:RNA polymerase sigma-70 factor (ECF subfamily)